MNILTKNLLAGAVVGSLALAGAVIAEENVKHKIIEIKAVKDKDVSVWVDSDGNSETLMFTAGELADSDLLAAKLANLDDDTRETVMEALQGINMPHDGEAEIEVEKVFVVNKGDGHRIKLLGVGDAANENDVDIEIMTEGGHKMIRKHFIHGGGKHGVLKGHTEAIAKLIERGEFSQEELDKIQAAVDAKR